MSEDSELRVLKFTNSLNRVFRVTNSMNNLCRNVGYNHECEITDMITAQELSRGDDEWSNDSVSNAQSSHSISSCTNSFKCISLNREEERTEYYGISEDEAEWLSDDWIDEEVIEYIPDEDDEENEEDSEEEEEDEDNLDEGQLNIDEFIDDATASGFSLATNDLLKLTIQNSNIDDDVLSDDDESYNEETMRFMDEEKGMRDQDEEEKFGESLNMDFMYTPRRRSSWMTIDEFEKDKAAVMKKVYKLCRRIVPKKLTDWQLGFYWPAIEDIKTLLLTKERTKDLLAPRLTLAKLYYKLGDAENFEATIEETLNNFMSDKKQIEKYIEHLSNL